ncbi:MAG: lipid A biosynthesis acyltransferase [Rubrivivax sp.]
MAAPSQGLLRELGPRLVVAALRLMQHLPMGLLVHLGRGLGRVLGVCARRRRHIARRNLELCFPQAEPAWRAAVLREHFALLGRSLVERALLWYAPEARVRALIRVEGDIDLAARSPRPVMWLVPHFLGLEVAGAAVQLLQPRTVLDIYQPQRNAYFDRVLKQGRLRFGRAEAYPRGTPIRQVMARIREGQPFFNMPDQDFGPRESSFVPFFGVPAATLIAPSRIARMLDMVVQPVVVDMLPGAQGWRVRFLPPLQGFPTEDALADAARMNAFVEEQIRLDPAQYLWVHKRFKTRPPGEPSLY